MRHVDAEQRWNAPRERNRATDEAFVYSVRTTSIIYCRPSRSRACGYDTQISLWPVAGQDVVIHKINRHPHRQDTRRRHRLLTYTVRQCRASNRRRFASTHVKIGCRTADIRPEYVCEDDKRKSLGERCLSYAASANTTAVTKELTQARDYDCVMQTITKRIDRNDRATFVVICMRQHGNVRREG